MTTNEHLLQEISNHKRSVHSRSSHFSNVNSNNDFNLYSPTQLAQQQQLQQQQQQREMANLVFMTNGAPTNSVSSQSGKTPNGGSHSNSNGKSSKQQQHYEQINGSRYSYSAVK